MKALQYADEKVQELILMLTELRFEYTFNKDSIDIKVTDRETHKKLQHEIGKIFALHKTPPLATQFDESGKILSIFDTRLR